ncbi:MAG: hypothetical protein U1G07_21240 [Verrucomicrobiota bacterium]
MLQRLIFCLLFFAATDLLHAANGVVYYNQVAALNAPALLGRINGDGTGNQQVTLGLPSPLYPTLSRDGRRLMVTSPDPGRPFKISQNVYVIDLVTGATGRATSYSDEFVLDGRRFDDDLVPRFGTRISSYKVNFPFYKAFSPEGARVVVMNLFKSGVISLQQTLNGEDVQAVSGRIPIVDVYNLADALPAGSYVYLSPQERDGFNQGGDGVDWHPALNEVVATVASDVPAVGTAGRAGLEGTILAVFSTASISPFIRKLTNPVGQADAFFNVSTLIYTIATPHDYAPSISPDGTRVAYVRHTLRQDTRFDGAGIAPLPALCSIRVVNYNGTDDREILRLNEGLWVSKVAWSPDATQIAFDLAPQQVLNGWNSLLGDPSRSSINIVNADGSNPRLLVSSPAAYPAWAPGGAPITPPRLTFRRDGARFQLQIDGLAAGSPFEVEGAVRFGNWASLGTFTAAGTSHLITITPDANAAFAVYRVRLR